VTHVSSHRVEALLLLAVDMIEDGAISGGILAAAVRHLGLDPLPGRSHDWKGDGRSLWYAACDAEKAAEDGQHVHLESRARRIATLQQAAGRIHREILSVAVFCASLAGVRDECLLRLSAAAPADAMILLDHFEEPGANQPWFRWPAQDPREWKEVERHGHRWLPWTAGDLERAVRCQADMVGPGVVRVARRCTCGVFEHEDLARRRELRRSREIPFGVDETAWSDDDIDRVTRWGNEIQMPRGPIDPV